MIHVTTYMWGPVVPKFGCTHIKLDTHNVHDNYISNDVIPYRLYSSSNDYTGIYHYFIGFVCSMNSWQRKELLPTVEHCVESSS